MEKKIFSHEKRDVLLNRVDQSYLCYESKIELKKTINALHNIIYSETFIPYLSLHLNYLIKSNSFYEIDNVIKLIEDIAYTYNNDTLLKSCNIVELYNIIHNLLEDEPYNSWEEFRLKSVFTNKKDSYTFENKIIRIEKDKKFLYANSYNIGANYYKLISWFKEDLHNIIDNKNTIVLAFNESFDVFTELPFLNALPFKELKVDIINIEYLIEIFRKYMKRKATIDVSETFLKNYFKNFIYKNQHHENFENKMLLLCSNIIESIYEKNNTSIKEDSFPNINY